MDATLTFQRFVKLNGWQHAELTLSNRSSRPLWYAGTGANNLAYDIQYSKGNSWEDWQDSRRPLGFKRFQLPPRRGTTFFVLLDSEEQVKRGLRVGVSCSRHEDNSAGVGRIFWSEKLPNPK
jgi:hypothetical protein